MYTWNVPPPPLGHPLFRFLNTPLDTKDFFMPGRHERLSPNSITSTSPKLPRPSGEVSGSRRNVVWVLLVAYICLALCYPYGEYFSQLIDQRPLRRTPWPGHMLLLLLLLLLLLFSVLLLSWFSHVTPPRFRLHRRWTSRSVLIWTYPEQKQTLPVGSKAWQ